MALATHHSPLAIELYNDFIHSFRIKSLIELGLSNLYDSASLT